MENDEENKENDITDSNRQGCNFRQPKFKIDEHNSLKINVDFNIDENRFTDEENIRELRPEEVLIIFSKISDEDCRLLGFDPNYSRPDWMIIQNLAVCPPQVRPSVAVDSSLRSQDDLTHQYNEILKINKELIKQQDKSVTTTTVSNLVTDLQNKVATLMNNELTHFSSQ